jgi:hypothetical protein
MLISKILQHIKVGQIYTDSNNYTTPKQCKLTQFGYYHLFVNHKVEFVSSLFDEINTNSIESLWKNFKSEIRKSRTTSKYICDIKILFS